MRMSGATRRRRQTPQESVIRMAARMTLGVALSCLAMTSVPAAPDLSQIRGAIVIVIAKGVQTKLGNAPAATQATGFFISKDGFLVTSYHVLTDLGDVDKATVTYEIHFDTAAATSVPAAPVFFSPIADVMVLYAPVGDRNVPVLIPGTRTGINPGTTPVYTAGYPAGDQYSMDMGIIKSFGGTTDPVPVWTTSLTFKAGQSGSPILRDDLKVIAIVRGNDKDAPSTGLIVNSRMVPNNYWDGTLTLQPAVATTLATSGAASLGYVNVQVPATAPTQRTQTFRLQNAVCAGPTTKTFHVDATPGWVIDPESIHVEMLSFTGASAHFVATNRSSTGFDVSSELVNIGGCVKVFGTTIPAGAAAQFTGQATYMEIPTAHSPQLEIFSSAAAIGNVQTPLPNVPIDQLRFTVSKPSGETVAFKPIADEVVMKNGTFVLNDQKVQQRVSQ